jgi:hypothetical protein
MEKTGKQCPTEWESRVVEYRVLSAAKALQVATAGDPRRAQGFQALGSREPGGKLKSYTPSLLIINTPILSHLRERSGSGGKGECKCELHGDKLVLGSVELHSIEGFLPTTTCVSEEFNHRVVRLAPTKLLRYFCS